MAEITELVTRTLEKVGIQSAWETVSAADQNKALQALKSAHFDLSGKGLLLWSVNDIPEELEEPYVLMAAWYAGDEFGFPQDPLKTYELGLRLVRQYTCVPKPVTPVEAEYF
jgi:hypothetical protein